MTPTGDGDGTTSWSVSGDESTWAVTVRARREVPTIACAVPGGLPAKRGIEYEVVTVERVDIGAR